MCFECVEINQFKDPVFRFLGSSCVESVNDDRRWLEDNFGRFRVQASFIDFITLKENFNGVSYKSDDLQPFLSNKGKLGECIPWEARS